MELGPDAIQQAGEVLRESLRARQAATRRSLWLWSLITITSAMLAASALQRPETWLQPLNTVAGGQAEREGSAIPLGTLPSRTALYTPDRGMQTGGPSC